MYDIVVIGSGLSSTAFLQGLKIENKKVAIISPSNYQKTKNKNNNKIESYIRKNLPPRFNEKKNIKNIVNFFSENNIDVDDNVSIFGNLDHGGVSNYWGGSCEFLEQKKINFLNNKNKKKLFDSYFYIAKKNNFSGNFDIFRKKKINSNQYKKKIDKVFEKIVQKSSRSNINFFYNQNAQNFKNGKVYMPTNLSKLSKKIEKLDLLVTEIKKNKNFYSIICKKNNSFIKILSKKIVLGAGTISTTRLICRMLNIKRKVKINHNPMLFGVLVIKSKLSKDNFSPSKLAATINDNDNLTTLVNFRSSNLAIKSKIFKNFKLMKNKFSKNFYNLLENNLLFFNLYLDSKYGNLNLKILKNNSMRIFSEKSKSLKIKKKLTNQAKKIYLNFKKNNLIYPFHFTLIPNFGNDHHYTGTIPINGKNKKLHLNENCELKNFKNLFVIDGSAIPYNSLKFPTALIISNAYRIGKNFK